MAKKILSHSPKRSIRSTRKYPVSVGVKILTILLLTGFALIAIGFYGVVPAFGQDQAPANTGVLQLNQVPPPGNPNATPTQCPAQSAIGGTIFLDGKPAVGFKVKLDPTGSVQTTSADGRYNYTGLICYFYVVRVIDYDTRFVRPINGRDYSNQTVTGITVETAIDIFFESVPQPTATPTPTPTPQPTATPVPSVTPTATAIPRAPECPGIPGGNNLQVSMKAVEVNPNFSYVCIRFTQSLSIDISTDLNHTIELNAPAAIAADLSSATAGAVTINASNLVWKAGILQPGQSVVLIVGVNASISSLGSLVTNISGQFSTGQSFTRTIIGILDGILEIAPIPVALPYTGKPAATAQADPFRLLVALIMGLIVLAICGFSLWRILATAPNYKKRN